MSGAISRRAPQCAFLTVLTTLALTPLASAQLLSIDSDYGPDTITRDTVSGLDLTLTSNRSVNDVTSQLDAGGELEGFRYASTTEIAALWSGAGIKDITTVGPVNGADWTAPNFAPANTLAQLFGVTITLPGGPASEGFSNDPVPGNPSLRIVGELNICSNPTGCPLIGAPTGTALASLGPNQKNLTSPFTFIGHFLVRVPADSDSDGLPDDSDNCTLAANSDQRDTNADGIGNLCDPDLNDDCTVNFTDLGTLKSVFFSADENADFDGNDAVNFGDLGVLKAFFFQPPGPSGAPNACAATRGRNREG